MTQIGARLMDAPHFPGIVKPVMFVCGEGPLKSSVILLVDQLGFTALDEEGKLVTGAKGASVTDGAFAESKDPITGYFKLAVSSTEEAVRLAQACPILAYGAQLEVGPLPNRLGTK
jgi:hypothetical protein